MKYIVFGGESYYASGGSYDYIDAFESLESAVNCANESIGKYRVHVCEKSGQEFTGSEIDWTHVFNVESKKIIHEPNGHAHNGGDVTIRLHDSCELDDAEQ